MTKSEIRSAIRYLKKTKITTVGFDIDDTLFDTSTHIVKQIETWTENVSQTTNLELSHIKSTFHKFSAAAFDNPEIHVRQRRWQWICDQMSQEFPSFAQAFIASGLTQFYESSPELFPQAKETVATLRKNGIKTFAVTHSVPYWHQIKMGTHDMRNLFNYHHIVDPEHFPTKTASQWADAMRGLGAKPENVMVIGDGIKQDILASIAAGVNHTVHIKPSWERFAQGTLPKNTHKIDNIAQLFPLLASL